MPSLPDQALSAEVEELDEDVTGGLGCSARVMLALEDDATATAQVNFLSAVSTSQPGPGLQHHVLFYRQQEQERWRTSSTLLTGRSTAGVLS